MGLAGTHFPWIKKAVHAESSCGHSSDTDASEQFRDFACYSSSSCAPSSSTSPVTSAELLYRTVLWNLENISYEIYSYTWQQRKDWMKLGVLKSMEFYFHRMKSSIDGQIQQLWMHLLLLLKILLPIFNSLVENFMHVHNVVFFFHNPICFFLQLQSSPHYNMFEVVNFLSEHASHLTYNLQGLQSRCLLRLLSTTLMFLLQGKGKLQYRIVYWPNSTILTLGTYSNLRWDVEGVRECDFGTSRTCLW